LKEQKGRIHGEYQKRLKLRRRRKRKRKGLKKGQNLCDAEGYKSMQYLKFMTGGRGDGEEKD